MKKILKGLFLISILFFISGCQEKKWEVSFNSDGGETFENVFVNEGSSVILPTPTKEGFAFLGWADEQQTVYPQEVIPQADLQLTAKWQVLTFNVRFEYEDGTLIKEESVNYGDNLVAPTPKNILGYEFIGWDQSFSNIIKDTVIVAQYEKISYQVTFLDDNDVVLKQETVLFEEDATAPTAPIKEGYNFIGWDQSFTNIVKNTIVVAQYEKISYQVTFLDDNDVVLKQETVLFEEDATAPTAPIKEGYNFIGWDQEFTKVTRTLTVKALYEEEAYGMEYVLDGEAYIVYGYTGSNLEVVIPSTYNGVPVTGIYEKAFNNNYSITKVTISEGIVMIGNQAFSGCYELKTVLLPESLNIIGVEAFNACSKLASITIGAATIGEAAFSGCTGLKSITLLDTVTTIGKWGFWGNSGLKTLFIPESVSTIGEQAFSWCTNLLTIYTTPANVSRLQTLLDGTGNLYVKYVVAALE
ncbi:MAG: leucine-rich repeat protein [Bacilli bacterium]